MKYNDAKNCYDLLIVNINRMFYANEKYEARESYNQAEILMKALYDFKTNETEERKQKENKNEVHD